MLLPQPDGPEERHERAGRDVDRQVVDSLHGAEVARDPLEAEGDVGHVTGYLSLRILSTIYGGVASLVKEPAGAFRGRSRGSEQ